MLKNQKGITLIALIITIIVMLILVGVTINVALNGGLFEKGEKAAFQTEASTVKEQLEMAKALKVMNAKGKPVEDYSDIIVGTLSGLDEETRSKYANKIVVNKNGDICYNPETVTNAEERTWLEEIGIKANTNIGGGSTAEMFTFTLGEIAANSRFEDPGWFENSRFIYVLFPTTTSDELATGINSTSIITCSDSTLMDVSKWDGVGEEPTTGYMFEYYGSYEDSSGSLRHVAYLFITVDGVSIKPSNWSDFADDYADLKFTITSE